MPDTPHVFDIKEQRRYRGAGKRGPLTGAILDNGFVQFSWGDAGATGDGPFPRPYDQVNWIEQGRMGFWIDGEEYELGPGEGIYIPAGANRKAWSVTDTYKIEVFGSRYFERWEFAQHQLKAEDPNWRGR